MRRVPSNRMPPFQEPAFSFGGKLLLLLWISLLILLVWINPWWFLCIPAVLVLLIAVQSWPDRRRERRIAGSRQGESLCSFVREFDYRQMDTWVIRAVYEQVQPLVYFPIRAVDHLCGDLRLDADDMDDVASEIAVRTGRPLDDTRQNPWYERVETVADLVAFFECQPVASIE